MQGRLQNRDTDAPLGARLFWNGLKHAGKTKHQLGAVRVDPRQRTGSEALSVCAID